MSSLASHFALSAQSLPAISSDCFRPRQGTSNGARCQSSPLAVTASQTRPLAPSLPPQSTSRYCHSRRADIAAPPRVMAAYAESAADGTPRLPNSFHEITSEQELDWVLKDAADCGDLVLIDWMAQWCRKCIYLKPKIEKLVPEYPKVRFFVVDVNKVPMKMVQRGGVTKMPTIQIWKENEKVEETVGGEAAWLVLENIRNAIKRQS
ncbi:unnamed protein product [Closterium sp. Yama58-4]|nr:unnamed protein product [Closterium sp. Yama58-4]